MKIEDITDGSGLELYDYVARMYDQQPGDILDGRTGSPDRYEEKGNQMIDGSSRRVTEPHSGFEQDIMGGVNNKKINQVHYDNWGKNAVRNGSYILRSRIDIDNKGILVGGKDNPQIIKIAIMYKLFLFQSVSNDSIRMFIPREIGEGERYTKISARCTFDV